MWQLSLNWYICLVVLLVLIYIVVFAVLNVQGHNSNKPTLFSNRTKFLVLVWDHFLEFCNGRKLSSNLSYNFHQFVWNQESQNHSVLNNLFRISFPLHWNPKDSLFFSSRKLIWNIWMFYYQSYLCKIKQKFGLWSLKSSGTKFCKWKISEKVGRGRSSRSKMTTQPWVTFRYVL